MSCPNEAQLTRGQSVIRTEKAARLYLSLQMPLPAARFPIHIVAPDTATKCNGPGYVDGLHRALKVVDSKLFRGFLNCPLKTEMDQAAVFTYKTVVTQCDMVSCLLTDFRFLWTPFGHQAGWSVAQESATSWYSHEMICNHKNEKNGESPA
jgi:hypothetical protein